MLLWFKFWDTKLMCFSIITLLQSEIILKMLLKAAVLLSKKDCIALYFKSGHQTWTFPIILHNQLESHYGLGKSVTKERSGNLSQCDCSRMVTYKSSQGKRNSILLFCPIPSLTLDPHLYIEIPMILCRCLYDLVKALKRYLPIYYTIRVSHLKTLDSGHYW